MRRALSLTAAPLIAGLALAMASPAASADLLYPGGTVLSEDAAGKPVWILQAHCAGLYGATSNVLAQRGNAEGAGAAALAALLAYPDRFQGKKVGVILCGGNIDTRLLASVLTRQLVRDQRLVSLRIIGDDRPGLLANVSALIGQMGANIVEVAHNRLALDVPAKGAEFDIMIETRDARHTEEIIEALRARGYPPRAV
jgi:hypothetical protein